MDCAGCGNRWFIEEKHVLPLDAPPLATGGTHSRYQASISSTRYVYRCSECGLAYGEKPKRKRKSAQGSLKPKT